MRVGDFQLDNTHRLQGSRRGFHGFRSAVALTIDGDVDALRAALWLETDRKYKQAVERLGQVKRDRALKVAEEDSSADFSRETPQRHLGALVHTRLDAKLWQEKLRHGQDMHQTLL